MNSKQVEYNRAMYQYHTNPIYGFVNQLIAWMILALQVYTVYNLFRDENVRKIRLIKVIIILIASYIMADFISGVGHAWADNNTNYKSPIGPLIAAFHLHHVPSR